MIFLSYEGKNGSPLVPKQDIYYNGGNVCLMRRDVYFNW